MKRPKELSAAFARTQKRPGRYGDGHGGHGLSLLVKERVGGGLAKSWSQRIRIGGRVTNLGLGKLPDRHPEQGAAEGACEQPARRAGRRSARLRGAVVPGGCGSGRQAP